MVAIGGGVGAFLRYAVTLFITKLHYPAYYATGVVNLVGSFLLGIVIHSLNEEMIISFLVVGVLGAFTTFSTFAFDFVGLFNKGHISKGINYILINLVGGLLLFAIGYYI